MCSSCSNPYGLPLPTLKVVVCSPAPARADGTQDAPAGTGKGGSPLPEGEVELLDALAFGGLASAIVAGDGTLQPTPSHLLTWDASGFRITGGR